jgi:hypothetical protein
MKISVETKGHQRVKFPCLPEYLKPGQKKRVKAAEARKRARKNKKRSWETDSDQHRS